MNTSSTSELSARSLFHFFNIDSWPSVLDYMLMKFTVCDINCFPHPQVYHLSLNLAALSLCFELCLPPYSELDTGFSEDWVGGSLVIRFTDFVKMRGLIIVDIREVRFL